MLLECQIHRAGIVVLFVTDVSHGPRSTWQEAGANKSTLALCTEGGANSVQGGDS